MQGLFLSSSQHAFMEGKAQQLESEQTHFPCISVLCPQWAFLPSLTGSVSITTQMLGYANYCPGLTV